MKRTKVDHKTMTEIKSPKKIKVMEVALRSFTPKEATLILAMREEVEVALS